MPLTQEDAERIGANIGGLFGFGEKRKARLETEALKRRADAELIVQQYLAEKAMERLKEQEAGDDRRAKLTQDREDYRERTRVGVMSDNARMATEQRDKEAAAELARRRVDDAMTWWIEDAKMRDARRKAQESALGDAERLAISAGNAERQLRDTGLTLGKERLSRYGIGPAEEEAKKEEEAGMFDWIFGSKPKPTNQPIFQSKKVQPSTGAAPPPTTPTPMPPTAEGTRKPASTGSLADIVERNIPGPSRTNIAELEGLLNVLTGKNIRLAPTNP